MPIQPIFVFSVPRSGSTLVQRIIAAHDGVATVPEPWLLLPYAYMFRRSGVDAEYLHPLMVNAIEEFCKKLPGGSEEYRDELRHCVLRLYEKAAGADAKYFVDKSPAYCFITDEIMQLFPEAKFVFLWRNPLGIISSLIQTWEPWHPTLHREDLFTGLPRLVSSYMGSAGRAYAVRFEDVVAGDERNLRPLMEYLDIEYDADALHRFSEVDIHGRMGDKTGVRSYASLSTEPTDKWKQTLVNPVRRAWCRKYLSFLGAERIAAMGYDLDAIVRELDSQPLSTKDLLPDIGRLVKDVAKEPIRVRTRSVRIGGPNVIRKLISA
jgi:hypothetical protein